MRRYAALTLALMLTACAETDPYKRLDPAPTGNTDAFKAADSFNERWPAQFKCVQAVTVDFRVATRALIGYLVVQQPGKFRLQGMTEHGIKLFEIVGNESGDHTLFAAEEIDSKVVAGIARDIRRIFMERIEYRGTHWGGGFYGGDTYLPDLSNSGASGDTLTYEQGQRELVVHLVGQDSLVDSFEVCGGSSAAYRVDQYELRDFGGTRCPSVIVLRHRGDGPSYKLTIQITELHVRDEPWPDSVFEVDE